MELTPQNFVGPLCLVSVVSFGIFAVSYSKLRSKASNNDESTEFFLTAKNSQPWYRIAFGFYACAIGAWTLYTIPSFITDETYGAGILGLVIYSLFSGIPFLFIAYFGSYIKQRFPQVISIGSFVNWRFGHGFQVLVTIVVLYNLFVALTAEYTSIGQLIHEWVGWPAYVPIVVVATVTMVYTAIGGLYIGLVTDQFQSLAILLLLVVIGISVAINFRIDELGELPPHLGLNYSGYSSIMSLGVALICSTLFSDAFWQRAWAAKDTKALYTGAGVGALMVITVTGLIGSAAFVASWAGLVSTPNLAFFDLVRINGDLPIGLLTILLLIASIMNESAVDTLQVALGDTVIGIFESIGISINIWTARLVLAALNIPCALIGTKGYSVAGLYLSANLLSTCLVTKMIK